MNERTQAAVNAFGIMGVKYVKRTAAHCYFEISKDIPRSTIEKLAKEFIRQTGIGCKFKLV